jgi:predicted Holliday junction resolvase-like endonuclease
MVGLDTNLVLLGLALTAIGIVIGYILGSRATAKKKEAEFVERTIGERKDAINRSRSTLGGQFLEKISPHLPDFPFDPTELRFIGTPVDFVVFRGLSTGKVEEVVFLEVKSGKGALTTRERSVRDCVESRNVGWSIYKVPISLTADMGPGPG